MAAQPPHNQTFAERVAWYLQRATPAPGNLDTPCLLVKPNTREGYRQFKYGAKRCYLHRAVLEQQLGRPLRGGYETRHLCKSKACVNIEHLREGTPAQNQHDRWRDGTTPHHEGEIRGTEHVKQRRKIAALLHERGLTYRAIGNLFGVAHTAIFRDLKRART